ncbi:hypothetical protein J5N97_012597 [Dioscorea zingiberensis]|uniref:DYW domain-containing protein n=1 Tax=Dioscorea zingiberensis TaxID=325984 RepID=A0A9D5CRZ0_9LILI|nr:hypothetical protein J5N97_012597 [Dioscorea zingiberensis]
MYSKCGDVGAAQGVFDMMPQKNSVSWTSLMTGYGMHGRGSEALCIFEGDAEESENDGSYTLLSNIYANAGRWRDVARIRLLMKKSGIKKRPGCSWVQDKNGTAVFFVGDRSHPQSQQIYALLASLIERIKAIGYVPQTHFALHDVDDEEKNSLLSEHSEKLALAYGILTSAPGSTIRITKNLRVCGDCHSAITFYLYDHRPYEIILRDSSRFHHFKKGSCSCGGYW